MGDEQGGGDNVNIAWYQKSTSGKHDPITVGAKR